MASEADLAKGVAKFTRNLRSKILSARAKDELSKGYANDAAEAIKRHTRNGFGLARDGDNLSRLKKLSPNYIAQRTQIRLSSETTPGKSNLTRKGDLLDSITTKRRTPGQWYVAMPGSHYSGLTNRQLARFLSRARPFLFLSKNDILKIGKLHQRRFDELVKRAKV